MPTNVDITRDAPRAPLAPVDPGAPLPPAVRAAAERAEAIHAQAYQQQPVEPQSDAPAAPAAAAPAGEAAPQQPDAPAAPAAPATAAPAPVTVPVTPPRPGEGVDSTDPNDQSWEHKFKSMQGRFHAQQQTMRQMQDQIADMGNELSRSVENTRALQSQLAVPPEQRRLVTDQERTDYGNDFIDVAQRAAAEAINPQVEALQGQVQSLQQSLQRTATQGIYQQLDTAVPNWRIINRHPVFVRWLGLRDPMSGAIRKLLLDDAFRAADAARVVTIFKGFVAEDAANRPAEPDPQSQAAPALPASAPRQPAVSLETLAAPGRARSSPPIVPGAAEKPVYTQSNIRQFYDDSRRGVYAGRDAEKDAIEKDIYAAQREGRVRG